MNASIRGRSSSQIFTILAGLAVVLALSPASPAAELDDVRGEWRTPEGDIIEFRLGEDSKWKGYLTRAAPQGLGRVFSEGAVVLQELSLSDAKLQGVVAPARPFHDSPSPGINEYLMLAGTVEMALDAAGGAMELRWDAGLMREHLRDDGFVLRTETSPLTIKLRRDEHEAPVLADLVGEWECKTEGIMEKNVLVIDNDPDDPKQEKLVYRGVEGWVIDPNIDPAKGWVWLARKPAAGEMNPSAPELRLRAAKGKVRLRGLLGDPCALTLTGRFYPGKIVVTGKKDPNTGAILEEGGEAHVATGGEANDGSRAVEFAKKWYGVPTIDQRVTFSWADPREAQARLGVKEEIFVMNELLSAATDTGAYTMYREFVGYIFKAWTYALPSAGIGAETVLGQIAQNMVENAVGKAIEGDALGKEILIEAVAATAASALVGHLVNIDEGHFDELSKSFAEELGERASGPLADRFKTKDEFGKWLEGLFTGQCRIEIQAVKLSRGISGIIVADKAKHEAQIVLYVPTAQMPLGGNSPSAVVTGRFNYINEAGVQPPSADVVLHVIGKN